MDDQNFFKSQLVGLADYFSKELSAPLVKIYWRKLKHLTEQELVNAVDQCVDELKFFPKVPEILERVPERPKLEHKGSISWCDNTQMLIEEYLPEGRKAPKHKPI